MMIGADIYASSHPSDHEPSSTSFGLVPKCRITEFESNRFLNVRTYANAFFCDEVSKTRAISLDSKSHSSCTQDGQLVVLQHQIRFQLDQLNIVREKDVKWLYYLLTCDPQPRSIQLKSGKKKKKKKKKKKR